MTDLVRFPAYDNPAYRDSAEGGLFVMLLIPEPENHSDNCVVDVNITVSSPDVCVNRADIEGIWQPYDYRMSGFQKSIEAGKALEAAGRADLATWAIRTTSPDETSGSMLAALHLGSDSGSFWCEQQGAYWSATVADLTDAGADLYNSLAAAYGITPILVTCLDT